MGESVKVTSVPHCQFCPTEDRVPAAYDAKTIYGPWANLCQEHFEAYGVGLGAGKGQRYVIVSE